MRHDSGRQQAGQHALAFRLDLGLYYVGIVTQPFKHGNHILESPPFTHARSKWPFRLMALYNRRFVAIAESRSRRGVFGRNNDRRHFGFISYEFNQRLPFRLAGLLCLWAGLELREGWRTWFAGAKAPAEFRPQLQPAVAASHP